MSAICEPCQNDEHLECSEPIATRAEFDTGYQHVLICCDGARGPSDDVDPDPDNKPRGIR